MAKNRRVRGEEVSSLPYCIEDGGRSPGLWNEGSLEKIRMTPNSAHAECAKTTWDLILLGSRLTLEPPERNPELDFGPVKPKSHLQNVR